MSEEQLSAIESLRLTWQNIGPEEKLAEFRGLPQDEVEDFFASLDSREQAILTEQFSKAERRLWMRILAPDDAADLLQEFPEQDRLELLGYVDEISRREIVALLSYREDEAGGLMSPRFARVRPDMLVAEATRYVQRQALSSTEAIHYVYVLDSRQTLMGVLSLRELFVAAPERMVSEIMETKVFTIPEEMDQEEVSRLFSQNRYFSIPVVDGEGKMKGIVSVDDILDVSEEEATEDIQKMGGTSALEAPYPQVRLLEMIKKRAGWLTLLFFGEMFTTSAMTSFEGELAQAVVLAMFIPLIISSGGNSGSQATSLIIRAMALEELRLRDWWRVLGKELLVGLVLGLILATVSFLRINLWPGRETIYTVHFTGVAIAVSCALVGVVLFGTVMGSMLPFVLRRVGLDPAAASAPLVATLVDVTGLVIYFEVAKMILKGTLL